MTPIRWSPQAVRDIESIREYIAHDSQRYADLMASRIIASVERLRRKEVANDILLILALEGDLSQGHLVAGVKIVCTVRHLLGLREWDVDE